MGGFPGNAETSINTCLLCGCVGKRLLYVWVGEEVTVCGWVNRLLCVWGCKRVHCSTVWVCGE